MSDVRRHKLQRGSPSPANIRKAIVVGECHESSPFNQQAPQTMKFGYDENGRLIPYENIELAEAIAKLDAQLDARPLSARAEDPTRIRLVLVSAGEVLAPEDNDVLSLYEQGTLDFHNVEHHSGNRLTEAFLKQDATPRNDA